MWMIITNTEENFTTKHRSYIYLEVTFIHVYDIYTHNYLRHTKHIL